MRAFFACGIAALLPAWGVAQSPVPAQLDLKTALEYAMAHSPVLEAARAEIAAAHAETGAVRAQAGPQVSGNAFASKGDMANVLSTGMGVEPQAWVLSPNRSFTDLNLSLMAPIYTAGVLSGRSSAALARERAARADSQEAIAEVALSVREAYLGVLLSSQLLEAQKSRVAATEVMVRNAQAQFEAGKAIEATIQRAQAELADAQRDLAMGENERSKRTLDLLQAMGAPLSTSVTLTDTLEAVKPPRSLDEYIQAALKNRGSLLSASQSVRAAQAQLSSARGELSPQVFGFAMSDSFSPADAMGKKSGYTVGLSLSVPLFDAGRRRNEVSAAAASVRKMRANEALARLQTEKEVRAAWLDWETAQANYKSTQAALSAAQSAYDVVALRVESGKSIQLEQLDALAALTRARANLAQSTFDVQLALARLERASGALPTGGANQ